MKTRQLYRLIILFCLPLLVSCASYNMAMQNYYGEVDAGNYDKALKTLQGKKILKRQRNQLLYNLEAGKLYFLRGEFDKSNAHFNKADYLVENMRKSAGSVALGSLLNPMHETYTGEDFEQFMVHYYKAFNYLSLGQPDEAVVEARRISLAENRQDDKFKSKINRYSQDAFALNLQGIIYEAAGDVNNAFISYRNAADLYLKNGGRYYGVDLPPQLQSDVMRTARQMGFEGEYQRYRKLFGTEPAEQQTAGELVLFFEEGRAPVKTQKTVYLNANGNGGSFLYSSNDGRDECYDFDYSHHGFSNADLLSVNTLRIALPDYQLRSRYGGSRNVSVNNQQYSTVMMHDINSAAIHILQERFVQEMAKAITRQITKQLLQKGAEAAGEGIAKSANKKKNDENASDAQKEENKRKRAEKIEAAGDAAAAIMSVINKFSEKADTRNWQSLPAFISYVRVPLHQGENTITYSTSEGEKTITIIANGRLQMRSETIY